MVIVSLIVVLYNRLD